MAAVIRGGAILVTGADGHLGRFVTRALLAATNAPIVAWIHGRGDFAARQSSLRQSLPPGAASRVRIVAGKLEDDAPFAAVDPAALSAIVHAAAVTRFNVDAATASAVNEEGTRRLLSFARRVPGLEALSLLSTLYVAGLRRGTVDEAPSTAPVEGFANHYEASKAAAETLVLGARGLPTRVLRLPTVIADDPSGVSGQRNAFHNTLRLLHGGLLAVMPGVPETLVHVTEAGWAARAIAALTLRPDAAGVYHLCAERAITLGELLDVAYETFAEDPAFRARRLLRPPFCDEEPFALLADAVQTLSGPVVAQGLASVTPFARQLFASKRYGTDRLRAALPDEAAPEPAPLVRAAVRALVPSTKGRIAA